MDLSVAAQLRALRDYAQKNGYMVAREYVDEAESGRIADRPEFRKMIDAASQTQRSVPGNLGLEVLPLHQKARARRRLQVHAPAQGRPGGLHHRARRRLPLRQAALRESSRAWTNSTAENLAQEVVMRGMRESASRGFWVSSYAPFGYNRVMVQDGPKKRPSLQPNPDASHIVKRIFDMAEAGNGTLNITNTLNEEGIASPRGKLWGKTSVHAILINEAYTGTLVWGVNAKDNAEPVRVEQAFPAIITKAQFSKVGKLMQSRAPKRSHPRRVGSTYLLSGLVKCKACGRALSAARTPRAASSPITSASRS